MPVDQAVAPTVSVATDVTQLAVDVTQATVEAVTAVTPDAPDQVGGVLDTLISMGQALNPVQGTVLAIVVAALVVVRMIWKKYKSSKK